MRQVNLKVQGRPRRGGGCRHCPGRPCPQSASEQLGGAGKAARARRRERPERPTRPPPRPTPEADEVSRAAAGSLVRGRRVTCSRCSWATRRRGKWRKQSRALVKATVTATPPPPAPARRSLHHIIHERRSPAARQAEGVGPGKLGRLAPLPAAPLAARR